MALSSELPPNAAHTLRNSLFLWEGQIHRYREPDDIAKTLRRMVILGDHVKRPVRPQDILRLSDYVGTAEEVVRRLRDVAYGAVARSLPYESPRRLGPCVEGDWHRNCTRAI